MSLVHVHHAPFVADDVRDDNADYDDDDDDADSDSGDDEEYTIIYEVPYKNATRELPLTSGTSYSRFLIALAGKMEVSVTHLSAIGYIPSYKPKNPKPVPKLLETATDYERMMEDIADYRKTCLNSKSHKVKPFTINLSDTSAAPGGSKVSFMQPQSDLNSTHIIEYV